MLGYSMVATINMGYTTSHRWQWWACCTACPLYKCNFGRCGGLAGNVGLARRKLVPASPLLMVLACFPPRSTRTNKQKTKIFASTINDLKVSSLLTNFSQNQNTVWENRWWHGGTTKNVTGPHICRCPAMSFVSFFLWQTQKNKTNGLSEFWRNMFYKKAKAKLHSPITAVWREGKTLWGCWRTIPSTNITGNQTSS